MTAAGVCELTGLSSRDGKRRSGRPLPPRRRWRNSRRPAYICGAWASPPPAPPPRSSISTPTSATSSSPSPPSATRRARRHIAAVHARLQRRSGHAHIRRRLHALNLWAHCWYSATRDASAPRGARQRCVVLLLPPSGIDGRAAVEAAGPSVLAAADAGGAAGARRALDELLQAGQSAERARPFARARRRCAPRAGRRRVDGVGVRRQRRGAARRQGVDARALLRRGARARRPPRAAALRRVAVRVGRGRRRRGAAGRRAPKRAPLPDVAGVANALFTRSGGRWCARLDLDGGGRFSSGGRFECDGGRRRACAPTTPCCATGRRRCASTSTR